MMATLWDLMSDVLPDDHARQVDWTYYVEELMRGPTTPSLVLDLGCGDGKSLEQFRKHDPGISWIGVEIPVSEYARPVGIPNIVFFDGVRLPLPTGSVPAVFSNQVLEHVRHPEELIREVCRVLQPGGLFVGKTSYLEAYHAHSFWNFTPYGFRVIVQDAGMVLEEIRPGIDAYALLTRSTQRDKFKQDWWNESPFNKDVDTWARKGRRAARNANGRKLLACGQFGFRVRKPG
jgi:SAM-dependent methyltransferase